MSEIQTLSGCEGCVDSSQSKSMATCEYLRNHGRVRPVPAREGGGCAIKAKDYAKQAELVRRHRWDPEQAVRLKKEGLSVEEIAERLNASPNALKVLFAGRDSVESDPTENRQPTAWPREEEYLKLYRAGLNDIEAGKAMGLHPTPSVCSGAGWDWQGCREREKRRMLNDRASHSCH